MSNLPLAILQRRVADAIMHPLTRSETMPRRRRDGVRNTAEAEAMVRPNDRLTSFERLEIYNRQYWFRLYSSFEEDFPGVLAILGRQKFDALMRAYLTECPSESFSLRNLGSRLGEWLTAHPDFALPRFELTLDMVSIEWAHIEAFDSAQSDPLDADDLAAIDEESRLRLQPYVRLLQLQYPVDDLLIEVRDESGSSAGSSNNASVARRTRRVRHVAMLPAEEIYLAVHRHADSVYYKRLHREDFLLLHALSQDRSLGDSIEAAFADSKLAEEEQSAFLRDAFSSWAQLGWFTRES